MSNESEVAWLVKGSDLCLQFYLKNRHDVVRRVSLPGEAMANTMFMCGIAEAMGKPATDGWLDTEACFVANERHVSYAEAIITVVDEVIERDDLWHHPLINEGETGTQRRIDLFRTTQAALERQWREEHNEWAPILPNVFD